MDERNAQQRKRRAEMTNEQREESKRRHREYQRQYRARKKAELQNISTAAVVAQIGSASSPAGEKYLQPMHFIHRLIYHEPPFICQVANFGTELSTIVENDESAEPTDWLHRNDNYVPGCRGPRTVLSRPLPTSGEAGQHINHILDFFSINKIKPSSYFLLCLYILYNIIYLCIISFASAAWQPCKW